MFMWKYEINGYDGSKYLEKGIVCGESYTEATQKLEAFYDKEICSISIEGVPDSECGIYILNTTVQN